MTTPQCYPQTSFRDFFLSYYIPIAFICPPFTVVLCLSCAKETVDMKLLYKR